jgi:hypothetical protein
LFSYWLIGFSFSAAGGVVAAVSAAADSVLVLAAVVDAVSLFVVELLASVPAGAQAAATAIRIANRVRFKMHLLSFAGANPSMWKIRNQKSEIRKDTRVGHF